MSTTVTGKEGRGEAPAAEGYPFVGVLPRFRRDPFALLLDATRESGDVVRLEFPGQGWLLLSRPDHVEHVLKDNRANYVKGYDKARVLLGNGLVMNEGGAWLRQRRLMQPAFHRRRLERFAGTMVGEAEGTMEAWEGHASAGRAVDVGREMTLLTQRVIVKTMFGSSVGTRGEKIAGAFDAAMRGIEFRSTLPLWTSRLPLPVNRRFGEALTTVEEEVSRVIGERRERADDGGQDRDDLLGMLLEARDEETGRGMEDRQVRDEVMGIYLAGHESTAVLLTWAWYLLSKHPEAARRVREEVADVLGDRAPGVGDLPNLVYTRMVIDETLRLYPSAWVLVRKALKDDEIGGCHVPAGSMLFVCPYVTHRREDLWENPEGFDPERFAPGRGDGRQRYAYYPFAGGPRQCIGQNFALMEATLIVASIARRYRLDLVPGQTVKPLPRGTLRPNSAVRMVPRRAAGGSPKR